MAQSQHDIAADRFERGGVAYEIGALADDERWSLLETQLAIMETWTQCLSAADIKRSLGSGHMRLWGIVDQANKIAFAITRMTEGARGRICALWLIASHFADDDSISALIAECESAARSFGCVVIEIHAYPGWADRIKGKLTAIVVERDLRPTLRIN